MAWLAESLEWRAKERESRVCESDADFMYVFSSRAGHEKPCLNLAGPPAKAKYDMRSIVN